MNKDDCKSLYNRAKQLNLNGYELLTHNNINQYCNGIGADWMPEPIRKMVTKLNPSLRLAAAIHDILYGIGGSEVEREEADEDFLYNGKLLAKAEYNWYNPMRYLVFLQARKFYHILRVAGGAAWNYSPIEESE